MSSPLPHRPDEPDPGYEVVDDPGYEVVDAPPPKPAAPPAARRIAPAPPAQPVPAARVLPAQPVPAARLAPPPVKGGAADPAFEVVDEPAGPPARPRSKPKVRLVEDAETVEVPRSKAKTVRVRAIDDEDDRYEDEDDRPRKMKRRKEAAAGKPVDEEANSVLTEWVGPIFMVVAGLVMTVVGTWGVAKGPEAAIAPMAAVVIRVVGEMISIPVTIIALMVIGSVFGIEYGTFFGAVRGLAAMGFLVGGLTDIFTWSKLPVFMYEPIIALIGLGLFMVLFRLDIWETLVTIFCLNVLSWVFSVVTFLIILAVLAKSGGKLDRDDDGLKPRDRQQQKADPNDQPWQDRGRFGGDDD